MSEASVFTKQYLMTAGPTPLPPRGQPGDGRADPLPPRAGLRRGLRAGAGAPAGRCSRPPTTCSASPPRAPARWSPRSPTWSRRATAPWSPRPASSASAGRELCEAYGAEVDPPRVRVGREDRPGRSTRRRRAWRSPPRAVFATQSETSTGVVHDVRALNEVAPRHDAMLCVDAVSGLGAVDLPQDEWGVDVVVSGSQKSLMCPPGLAFVSVSERALATRRRAARPPLLLRLGPDRRRSAPGPAEQRLHPRGHPVAGAGRRPRADPGGGAGERVRPPRAARPRRPRRSRGARAWSGSAPTRTPTSSPRRRSRTRSTAPGCRS